MEARRIKKCLVLALLIGMNWQGLWAVGETVAFFNDTEESAGNGFTAGKLDFSLDPTEIDEEINLGGSVSFSSDIVDTNNVAWKYTVEAEKISGSDDMCNALELAADVNGAAQYDGAFLLLHTEATSTIGMWDFDVSLPNDAPDVADGDTCEIDIVWRGWQAEIPTYEESGFSDEERISVTLTARETSNQNVVLNEFLPNPNGFEYGFDFGEDHDDKPQGEWVELYNINSAPFDLTGWYIEDASGSAGNTIYITSANTDLATTTIGGTGWLVVYMNKAVLNNTGDTVKLFNADGELIDSHTYTSNDYCDLEPTPGEPNDTEPSGDCGGVPPNKSYARIPDGVGEWVDPIPTPGGVNKLEEVSGETEPDQEPVTEPVEEETTNTVVVLEENETGTSTPVSGEEETEDETTDTATSTPPSSIEESEVSATETTENGNTEEETPATSETTDENENVSNEETATSTSDDSAANSESSEHTDVPPATIPEDESGNEIPAPVPDDSSPPNNNENTDGGPPSEETHEEQPSAESVPTE